MSIHGEVTMSHEALLIQLGYGVNESTLMHIKRISDNTRGFEYVQTHLVALHDALKRYNAFVALSNNQDYFKIKIGEQEAINNLEEVQSLIHKWSEKYKIALEKVPNKHTYYIIGYQS